MPPSPPAASLGALARAVRHVDGLDVLLLFGSRARGQAHEHSDWDFGYLGAPSLDVSGLLADLVAATGSDRVDLVDLGRASGVLRFQAARDGQVVVERVPGLADAFRLEAASFWCDVAPILGPAYEQVLAELDR